MRRIALPVVTVLLLLTACGEEPTRAQDTFQGTFDAAMQACHDGDLKALWPYLTLRAQEGVERTLRDWQRRFRDKKEGPHIRSLIEERLGPLEDAVFEQAARGTIQDAFRLMIRADPRPAHPEQRGLEFEKDGRTVRVRYLSISGGQPHEAVATLVRRDSGWFLDELWL